MPSGKWASHLPAVCGAERNVSSADGPNHRTQGPSKQVRTWRGLLGGDRDVVVRVVVMLDVDGNVGSVDARSELLRLFVLFLPVWSDRASHDASLFREISNRSKAFSSQLDEWMDEMGEVVKSGIEQGLRGDNQSG